MILETNVSAFVLWYVLFSQPHTAIHWRCFKPPLCWYAGSSLASGAASKREQDSKYDTVVKDCSDLPPEIFCRILVVTPILCNARKVRVAQILPAVC